MALATDRGTLQHALCETITSFHESETFSEDRLISLGELAKCALPQDQDMALALQEMVAEINGTHEMSETRGAQIHHLANTGILSAHFLEGEEQTEPFKP